VFFCTNAETAFVAPELQIRVGNSELPVPPFISPTKYLNNKIASFIML
jgi:hypothetical protein